MHEFSIVSSLLESCEEIAKGNDADRILVVYVEIGERSGVNPELLQSAFDTFKIGSKCERAELNIAFKKVELTCRSCEAVNEINGVNYTKCPKCQSENVFISRGNEMLLLRLEME
ncbi:hydrogenase/urease nickel incorporation protein HypA [Helicobacter turcicus]|uniref:Hydrogenase maturation factor HypA n=1 Tax=Helicobacter turcicus TaxID=2867412 RepID=A0ABS7JKP2_9HELI|nr:hydrogenase/urease nickel incorporation protein HypA [Helicobacter turcicus]MBX7489957.1 hydrogenase/urease nickel incorporation protein HypA [Helicobacter turcicus]MBX7544816.1 hydrogenase/urease nickel incorporation protein HypA [Helicobacter turcicus]